MFQVPGSGFRVRVHVQVHRSTFMVLRSGRLNLELGTANANVNTNEELGTRNAELEPTRAQ
jgi:hypothetical protein